MLTRLEKRFPNAVFAELASNLSNDYFWLDIDECGHFGIPMDELCPQEMELLKVIFTANEEVKQKINITVIQQQWFDYLFNASNILPAIAGKQLRFIQFTLEDEHVNRSQLEEAFKNIFLNAPIVVWDSENTGVIVEPKAYDSLSAEEIKPYVYTLNQDFYTDFNLYIGEFYLHDIHSVEHFKMEEKCFGSIRTGHATAGKVSTLSSSFPNIALKGLHLQHPQWFIDHLLGPVQDDGELIFTIKSYIERNCNATVTAKDLYIHRNSLQYRIEKFIQRTSLDIKKFDQRLTAYMAIQLL